MVQVEVARRMEREPRQPLPIDSRTFNQSIKCVTSIHCQLVRVYEILEQIIISTLEELTFFNLVLVLLVMGLGTTGVH